MINKATSMRLKGVTEFRCLECYQPQGSLHFGWCSKVGGSGGGAQHITTDGDTLPSPTEDEQKHPLFLSIFHVLKSWDIRTERDTGYCGGNGSHALLIFNALREELTIQLAAIDLGTKQFDQ